VGNSVRQATLVAADRGVERCGIQPATHRSARAARAATAHDHDAQGGATRPAGACG
jgi:hypothetical protein